MLSVNPEDCLVDEKIHVKICSLKPHQRTTLRCETIEKNCVYDSYAHYIADYNGEVDLSLSPSFGGSYKGIDAMGIFWSMLPAKGQMIGMKYKPSVTTIPCKYSLKVYDGFLTDDNFEKQNQKATASIKYPIVEKIIKRRFCAKNVTREEIFHGRVRGVLYRPKGPGPFKGVIDIYGGGGGLMDIKAPLIASHRFVVLILPFFRYKDLPRHLGCTSVEYFLEAIDYFTSLPYILPGIALVGLSWGASIVLYLSTICKKISSVVSINGSPFLFPIKYKGEFTPNPIDFLRFTDYMREGLDKWNSHIDYYKPKKDYDEKMFMKLELTNAKLMIIVGESDLTYDREFDSRLFLDYMRRHNQESQMTLLSYPGAGHFIEPPYLPQTLVQYNPTFGSTVACGGEKVQNAMACIHFWREMLHFLNANTGTLIGVSKL